MPRSKKKSNQSPLYRDDTFIVPQGTYAIIDLNKEKYLATQVKECVALVIKDKVTNTLALLHVDLLTSKEVLDYSLQEAFPDLLENKQLKERYTVKFFGANFNSNSIDSINAAKNNLTVVRECLFFKNSTDKEFKDAHIKTDSVETWFRVNGEFAVTNWPYIKQKMLHKPTMILNQLFKDDFYAKFYFFTSYRYIWDIYKITFIPLIDINLGTMPNSEATLEIPNNFIIVNYGLRREMIIDLSRLEFFDLTKCAPENWEELTARTFMIHTFIATQKIAQDVTANLFNNLIVSEHDKNKVIKIITGILLGSKQGYQLFKLQAEKGSELTQWITEKIQPVFNLAIERLTVSGIIMNAFSLSNLFKRPCCPNARINFNKFTLRKLEDAFDLETLNVYSINETYEARKFSS